MRAARGVLTLVLVTALAAAGCVELPATSPVDAPSLTVVIRARVPFETAWNAAEAASAVQAAGFEVKWQKPWGFATEPEANFSLVARAPENRRPGTPWDLVGEWRHHDVRLCSEADLTRWANATWTRDGGRLHAALHEFTATTGWEPAGPVTWDAETFGGLGRAVSLPAECPEPGPVTPNRSADAREPASGWEEERGRAPDATGERDGPPRSDRAPSAPPRAEPATESPRHGDQTRLR